MLSESVLNNVSYWNNNHDLETCRIEYNVSISGRKKNRFWLGYLHRIKSKFVNIWRIQCGWQTCRHRKREIINYRIEFSWLTIYSFRSNFDSWSQLNQSECCPDFASWKLCLHPNISFIWTIFRLSWAIVIQWMLSSEYCCGLQQYMQYIFNVWNYFDANTK